MIAYQNTRSARPGRTPSQQKGVSLIVALVALVVMAFAGVALVRSVDTGTMIAGNLAFRQSSTISGDAGTEAARAWLAANPTRLTADSPTDGYYATNQDNADLTGNRTPATTDDVTWPNWPGQTGNAQITAACLAADAAGNTVCYVINRLCTNPGPLDSGSCASAMSSSTGASSKGSSIPNSRYQQSTWTEIATAGYYRVTIRVAGPRNNVTYLQVFIQV